MAYLRAVDPDQGDDFHYSLLLNSYQQIPLAIVGNHLVSHTTVDYETSHLYDILIKACDKGGLCVIKVSIADINISIYIEKMYHTLPEPKLWPQTIP